MCCILTISDNCYNQSHPGDAFFCGPLNSVAHVVGGCYYYRPCISQLNQSVSSHKLAFLKCKPLLLTFFLKKGLNDKVMSHEIMKYTWICFYLSLRLWKQLLCLLVCFGVNLPLLWFSREQGFLPWCSHTEDYTDTSLNQKWLSSSCTQSLGLNQLPVTVERESV